MYNGKDKGVNLSNVRIKNNIEKTALNIYSDSGDDLEQIVEGSIEFVNNLRTVDAIYHKVSDKF